MANEGLIFKIEKLTAHNYHSWIFNMKMYRIGKHLWEIVTGTEVMSNICLMQKSEGLRNVKIKHLLLFL